ncbi:MAG TPA: hypothetical protein VNW28_06745, partial [Chthoniobacterales bacterium]|nr:hypothetical protein [Chthoniobacterales bacterium]
GLALFLGVVAAILAWMGTAPFARRKVVVRSPEPPLPKSKRARRRMKLPPAVVVATPRPPWHFWAWAVGIVFMMFAVRLFCLLLWVDGNHWKIQSPNNLGDLSLHITYIKYFANGVPLWPDNPIHLLSSLRYPAGFDLFNSLLLLQHIDLISGLVWTGLLGSAATFYGFYRWGGPFGVAGFLFNGGLAGYEFFKKFHFADYQADKLAWKSIPLAMFVTQRGLLYAIPAGLLLLLHWRRKYYPPATAEIPGAGRGLIPWWVEWSIYATMPLFHVHTFLALSAVLACWLLIGTWEMRKQIALLLAAAFGPASAIVWMITDHFQAKSILAWAPGWVQGDASFATPAIGLWFVKIPAALGFWIYNFGLMLPAMIALVGVVGWRMWKVVAEGRSLKSRLLVIVPLATIILIFAFFVLADHWGWDIRKVPVWIYCPALALVGVLAWPTLKILQPFRGVIPDSFAFVVPAVAIFVFAIFVKTAPWGWDNTKLIVWAYFIALPFLWSELIARWKLLVRAAVCFVLFASGFVSLFGGLAVGSPGFDLADRTEVDAVATVVRKLPIQARFAAFPTYNHLLLLNGRKVVLGYPGHLWTQGLEYGAIEQQLQALMLGTPDWRERARALHARYLFWGEEEMRAYGSSSQPWRGKAAVVATGSWGTIYDLESRARAAGQ